MRPDGHRPVDGRPIRHHLLFTLRQHDIRRLSSTGYPYAGFLQSPERRLHFVTISRLGRGRQPLRGPRILVKGTNRRRYEL